MTSLLRAVLALCLLSASSAALAAETWAQGRVVLHSCVYASSYEAEVGLSYRNYTLPWGTSVSLVYGWSGSDNGIPFDWDNTQTVVVSASAPYTWSATVRSQLSSRSSPKYYTDINFVWKVVLPNGYEFYEKGNGSTWGYYSASLSEVPRPCTSDSSFIGDPWPLPVISVEKW